MARVLIAGCGDVGIELGKLLVGRRHEVWGLRRRAAALPSLLHPLAADLGDPASLSDLPACDLVVYAAAADGRSEEAYRRAYVDGVIHLLGALEEQHERIRRFFFVSSTGVYGQRDGEWIDEDSPAEPEHWSGRLLLEGEERAATSVFPATAVRLAGIYGPGRTRLIDQVRSGAARLTPEPTYTNRIHRDDCAGFLAHLVQLELAGERVEDVYIGVDDDPAERNDVLVWLAERLGVARPKMGEAARRGRNKRCRNVRLTSSGYRLRYPSFREGYGALVDDYVTPT